MNGRAKTWALLSVVVACGGAVQDQPDAAGDGGADVNSDGLAEAGWTKCKAPSGVSLCGGDEHCGVDCPLCADGPPDSLRLCYGPSGSADVRQCPDGFLLADYSASSHDPKYLPPACVHEDQGRLYALNGRPDLVHYADRGGYAGQPIPPPPTSCPLVAGLSLCGGACGACPDPKTQVCLGRSLLHPYSLCVNKFGKVNTPEDCRRGSDGVCNQFGAGLKCLTFKVDAASQALSDANGMCVSPAICDAAAAAYPGGAFCTTGSP